MANIYFKCPSCAKSLAVDEDGAGKTINCPDCNKSVQIPTPSAKWKCSCGEDMLTGGGMTGHAFTCARCGKLTSAPVSLKINKTTNEAKNAETQCPSCGKSINNDSVICIHCGLNFKTGKRIKTHYNTNSSRIRLLASVFVLVLITVAGVIGYNWLPGTHLGLISSDLYHKVSAMLPVDWFQKYIKKFSSIPQKIIPHEDYPSLISSGLYHKASAMLQVDGFEKYISSIIPNDMTSTLRLSSICPVCKGGHAIKASMQKCSLCGGKGVVARKCDKCTCNTCSGNGLCVACNGQGILKCDKCNGTGMGEMLLEEKQCMRCRGSGEIILIKGSVKCQYCKGAGKISVSKHNMCAKCNGHKYITCISCNGTKRCKDCNGRGRHDNCQICNGTGIITTTCECRQSKTEAVETTCTHCTNSGIVNIYELPVHSEWINKLKGFVLYDVLQSKIIDCNNKTGGHQTLYSGKMFIINVNSSELVCVSTDSNHYEWVNTSLTDAIIKMEQNASTRGASMLRKAQVQLLMGNIEEGCVMLEDISNKYPSIYNAKRIPDLLEAYGLFNSKSKQAKLNGMDFAVLVANKLNYPLSIDPDVSDILIMLSCNHEDIITIDNVNKYSAWLRQNGLALKEYEIDSHQIGYLSEPATIAYYESLDCLDADFGINDRPFRKLLTRYRSEATLVA